MFVGIVITSARQVKDAAFEQAKRRFLMRAEIDSRDDIYRWLIHWLSSRQEFLNSKSVTVTSNIVDYGATTEDFQNDIGQYNNKNNLLFIPAPGYFFIRYKYRWLLVQRLRQEENQQNQRIQREKLQFTCLGGSQQFIRQIIDEAEESYQKFKQQRTRVFTMDSMGYWSQVSSRPIRKLNTIILPNNIAEEILLDCKEFVLSENWYASRGVPYRRGYLLYGKPGTGKTSLVTALAGELKLPIYVLSLSSTNLNDEMLRESMNSTAQQSIILLEDVDAAFTSRILNNEENNQNSNINSQKQWLDNGNQTNKTNNLSFSGLLNAIDGVAAQEGRTNHIERLDPALIRPGRVDFRVEFDFATQKQIRDLFIAFYQDLPQFSGIEGLNLKQQEIIDDLGEVFAKKLNGFQFSISQIQGHLMSFKDDPFCAIEQHKKLLDVVDGNGNNFKDPRKKIQ
eukprot:TRINITY_DN12632_c0_g1_i1.p1 TRINITY_DN12632_c0_g1~~TRINITY_DN12632_c0_g1_i1.p1  ORF type:complete len:452 (-),score=56.69 TRINITY_DN12632_c0_g1_i1:113-1468(-)